MSDVIASLRRYGLQPKRSLGQNFLVDESHLAAIVEAANLCLDDTVLEIGPGIGVLTEMLARDSKHVVAVELDDRMIEILNENLGALGNVEIVHGDILDLAPGELVAPAQMYKVVANLPYYITSAVLRHLLEADLPPQMALVMVQREVADRICAEPGDLSLLGVSVQYYAEPSIERVVPAGAFYPSPKVDSALVRLDVRKEPVVTGVESERFFRVVRAGFSQKRKQLANSLSAGLGLAKDVVRANLTRAGIDYRRRPETITLAEWGAICVALE